jgi:hypothetical protein
MDIQTLESEIQAVAVYLSGAVITRVAKLTAQGEWPSHVRISGLPLAIDDASVKARLESGDGLEAPGVESFRVALEVVGGAVAEPPEEEALRQARQELLALEGRQKLLERLAGRLAAMPLPSRPAPAEGEPPPPSPHAGRIALMDFQQRRLAALHGELRELRSQLKTAREALEALEDRKRRASVDREPRRNELRKTVVVALRAPRGESPGAARLVLEYYVPGTRWAPAYSVHFDSDWSHATLEVRAMVAQRTGEDWRNVRLAVSTAAMQAWIELPELASLRVGRWQSPAKSGWRAAPEGADRLYTDYDRDTAAWKRAQPRAAVMPDAKIPAMTLKASSDTGEFAAAAIAGVASAPPAAPPAPGEFTRLFSAPAAPAAPAAQAAGLPAPPPAEFTTMFSEPPPPMPPAPARGRPLVGAGRFAMRLSTPAAPPAAEPILPAGTMPERITQPAASALDYPALYMPGPDDAGRGKLARAEAAATVEVFAQARVRVRVNAAALVQAAQRDAASTSELPPGHAVPSSPEGFDYAYGAPVPVDIPSDGRFHSIPIAECEADVRRYYVTVPRESPEVFRFAEIGNPMDAPLLPGPAEVYAGGSFLMTAPMRMTPPKGMIKLGLGVEQQIKVARNTTFAEEGTGIMGGSLVLKHEIDIGLRNLLRTPAEIEVRERVPVAREGEEHLKVTTRATPPWQPYEPPEESLRGGYRWQIRMAPTEETRLHAAYHITIPAKMEVAGGNRREQ